ncbi:MAG: hypothetical protein ACQEQU_03655 [Spirochaetota bacterium]
MDASDFSLGGSAQTRVVGLFDDQRNIQAASLSAGRLKAGFDISNDIHFDGTYTISTAVFPASLGMHNIGLAGDGDVLNEGSLYRIWDLPEQLTSCTGEKIAEDLYFVVNQNLDRFFASVFLPFGDLYIGRQAISWGSARGINPTSVFSSFEYMNMQTDEQRGVDALRLRIPFGMMGEIDSGYVFGKDFRYAESAAFARLRTYIQQTDLTVLLMDVQEHLLVGFDAARSIGGASTWIEAAYLLPNMFDSQIFDNIAGGTLDFSRQQVAFTIGMDYTFSPKLYGFAEYHFNSAGKHKAEEYLEISIQPDEHPTYRDGLIQLAGRHYALLGGTYQLHPLLPLQFAALVNAGDPSAALSLEMEYSLTQDTTITFGSLINLGKKSERSSDGTTLLALHSEFGANPQVVYCSAHIYF